MTTTACPRIRTRRRRSIVAIAVAMLVTAGCSGNDETSDEEAESALETATSTSESSPTTTPPSTAFVEVTEQPGVSDDSFVGARDDVTVDECRSDDSAWFAEGTVENTTSVDASYRIYVAFNEPDSAVSLGLVQVDVDVAAGGDEAWNAEAPISAESVDCILRVERIE